MSVLALRNGRRSAMELQTCRTGDSLPVNRIKVFHIINAEVMIKPEKHGPISSQRP